jgi:hypothetical protein
MNSFTQLVQHVKNADWSGANQVFSEIMQQKTADRIEIEKQTVFKEGKGKLGPGGYGAPGEDDGGVREDAESGSGGYKAYFKSMLKKHGYDSPADIPADKKDDFFNAVDKGYKAKNEAVDDDDDEAAIRRSPERR